MPPETQPMKPMQSTQSLFANFQLPTPTTKARNEREELLEQFVAEINREREGTNYKPVTFMAIKVKTAHLDLYDLKYFYRQCLLYKGGFSKCFFGALKTAK